MQRSELPTDFTLEKREKFFQELTLTYDLLGKASQSIVRVKEVHRRERLMAIAAPCLMQMRCSTDIIAALYNQLAFHDHPITQELRDMVTKAYRNIFDSYSEFLDKMEAAFIPPDEIDPLMTIVSECTCITLLPDACQEK
jgi:hypothetical protein